MQPVISLSVTAASGGQEEGICCGGEAFHGSGTRHLPAWGKKPAHLVQAGVIRVANVTLAPPINTSGIARISMPMNG